MAIQDHNLQISEQQYRDLDLPSYSMLSAINKQGIDVVGGQKINLDLKFGSLVDCMCFEPHRVDYLFYQGVSAKPPTKNVKDICDIILTSIGTIAKANTKAVKSTTVLKRKSVKTRSSSRLIDYSKEILVAAKSLGVYKSYDDAKTIKTVVDAGKEYFKDKVKSKGKTLIKPEMWKLAQVTAATLMTHPFTAKYFATNVDGVEIFYQYKAEAVVNGKKVKVMLDCLIVNHKAKLVFPVDLKTGEESLKAFPNLFTIHGYYLQAGLYREAIQCIVDNDFELYGYTVKPFEFIYISKLNPGKPMKFVVDDDVHNACLSGFTDRYGVEHKGVLELLEEYYYCVESGNVDYLPHEIKSKGTIIMDKKMIMNA